MSLITHSAVLPQMMNSPRLIAVDVVENRRELRGISCLNRLATLLRRFALR